MKVSDNGLQAIRIREGFETHAYPDTRGIPTIGVGHTGAEVHLGLVWTVAQVNQALAHDIGWAEDEVNTGIVVPLTQNQFDALVSVCFNIGKVGFHGSSIRRQLNQGNYAAAVADFAMWETPSELKSRREGEMAQFKRPDAAVDGKADTPVAAAPQPPAMVKLSIQQIQALLNSFGANPPIAVDGDWGEQTRNAVIDFQRSRGLVPDGLVGRATTAALLTR